MSVLTERPQWRALQQHFGKIERLHLRELFAEDPELAHDSSTNALIRRYRELRG